VEAEAHFNEMVRDWSTKSVTEIKWYPVTTPPKRWLKEAIDASQRVIDKQLRRVFYMGRLLVDKSHTHPLATHACKKHFQRKEVY
jgi:hypothetical protein